MNKERVAQTMHAHLPIDVLRIIENPEWNGSELIILDDPMGRPSAAVLAKNSLWIKAFVQHNRNKAMMGAKYSK